MSIVKEFREFFLRATAVNSGAKADQETGFATSYFVNGIAKFNRFLKGHYPSEDVMKKFMESITFKLNKEDRAQASVQGLGVIATDANAKNRTSNATDGTANTAFVVPHQLPEIISYQNEDTDVIIGSASNYKGIKITEYTRTPEGGSLFRKVYAVENTGTRKFVKEVESLGDGDIITIDYADISADGVFADGSLASGTTAQPKTDYVIKIWGLVDGKWSSAYDADILKEIDETTGDLTLTFDFAPFEEEVPFRVIIIG